MPACRFCMMYRCRTASLPLANDMAAAGFLTSGAAASSSDESDDASREVCVDVLPLASFRLCFSSLRFRRASLRARFSSFACALSSDPEVLPSFLRFSLRSFLAARSAASLDESAAASLFLLFFLCFFSLSASLSSLLSEPSDLLSFPCFLFFEEPSASAGASSPALRFPCVTFAFHSASFFYSSSSILSPTSRPP